MVISGGNFKPDTLKPKEVVSLLLDDEELEKKRMYSKPLINAFSPPCKRCFSGLTCLKMEGILHHVPKTVLGEKHFLCQYFILKPKQGVEGKTLMYFKSNYFK